MAIVIHAVFCCLGGASLLYYILCVVAARSFFSRRNSSRTPSYDIPPVSVLIPLCGAEFEAYENHASFCRQDLPGLQVIFGVMDPDDAAVPVVKRLMADFPELDLELVVGTETIGTNPKVNNLHNMLKRARHDLLVMVDSDVRMRPGQLVSMLAPLLGDRADMVTCLYRAGSAPGAGAGLEAMIMSADFIPGVLVARLLEGITFALGALIAVPRRVLEAAGGLEAVADTLVEDYLFGHHVRRLGGRIAFGPGVVETMLSPMTMREVWKHQVRLARGRKACRPGGYFGSLIVFGPAICLLHVLLSGGSTLAFSLLALVLAARLWSARSVGVRALGDQLLGRSLWLLPLKDVFGLCVWCASFFGNSIQWRGRTYRLDRVGRMTPVV